MVLEIPDLIGEVVALMRTYIERVEHREANVVERASAYLDAAAEGIAGLGQTAQRLHSKAATFDPEGATAEEDAQLLIERVHDYLHVNVLTLELDGVIGALGRIGSELDESGGRRPLFPRTRRKRSEAVAELTSVLKEVDSFLKEQIVGLYRHLGAGTGICARTLRDIEEFLASRSWRDKPKQAKAFLRQAAKECEKNPEHVSWQKLAPRFPELKEALLNAFPAP